MTFDLSVEQILTLSKKGRQAREVLNQLFPGIIKPSNTTYHRCPLFTLEQVSHTVCEYFNTDFEHVRRRTRKKDVIYVRFIIFYLAFLYTRDSLAMIGDRFDLDHTSVIHGRDTVHDQLLLDHNTNYKTHVKALELLLNEKYSKP